MMWYDKIRVALDIRGFRVGRGYGEVDVDLPSVKPEYASSSIKGLLRREAEKVVNLNLFNLDKRVLFSVFGSELGLESETLKETKEGKIRICEVKSDVSSAIKRYGIKVSPLFGSVELNHLFSYEYIPARKLEFSILPMFPLTGEEALLLYCSINFLNHDCLGGFGSRGLGLIEKVRISENFENFVRGTLKNLEGRECL